MLNPFSLFVISFPYYFIVRIFINFLIFLFFFFRLITLVQIQTSLAKLQPTATMNNPPSSSPPLLDPYLDELEALLPPAIPRASLPRRAATAASYPFRGVWFFATHRELWPIARGRLLPLSLLSLGVYFVLFTFTFLPQVALLAIFQGRAAWAGALFLVLGEGLVIIQVCFDLVHSVFCIVWLQVLVVVVVANASRLFLRDSLSTSVLLTSGM